MRTYNSFSESERIRTSTERRIGALLIAFGVFAIAVITLTPVPESVPLPVFCLTCGDRPAVDFFLNILLFVPLGTGLALIGLDLHRAVIYGVCATLLVETVQFVAIAGRYASVSDVLSNTLGVFAGYLVAHNWKPLAYPSHRLAWRAFVTAAVLWLATQVSTAWAMGLALPPTPWWGQIKPQYDRYPAVFRGRVVALAVGSVPIVENDTIPGADKARRELLRGASIRATVTNVQLSRGIAPVVIVVGNPPNEVAMWALDGTDAVFGITVRGTGVGLRAPSVVLAGVTPTRQTDTLTLTGSYAGGYYRLRSDDGIRVRTRVFGVSPSLGWALVAPLPNYAFGQEVRLFTAIWLACTWAVLGYWTGRASLQRAPWKMLGAALVTMAIGLGAVPYAFGLPLAHWSEWIAVLLGFALPACAVRIGVRRADRGVFPRRER